MAGLIALVFLPGARLPCAAEPGRALVEVLPESTAVYVHLDVAKILAEGSDLRLARMLQSPEVAPFVAPLWEYLQTRLALQARDLGLPSDDLAWSDLALDMEYGLLGASLDLSGDLDAGLAFAVSLRSRDPDRTATVLDVVLRSLVPGFTTSQERLDDVAVRRCFVGQREVCVTAVLADRVLIAESRARVVEMAAALGASDPLPRRLAGQAEYRRWRAVLDEDHALLEGYVSLRAMTALLMLSPDASVRVLRELGLLDVRAAGYAVSIADEDLREVFALLLPEERRGLLRLYDVLTPEPGVRELLPLDADAFLVARCDLARVIDVVDESFQDAGLDLWELAWSDPLLRAQLSPLLGEDPEPVLVAARKLIGSLGDQLAVASRLPEFFAMPEIVIEASVREPEVLRRSASSLREALSAAPFEWTRSARAAIIGPTPVAGEAPDPNEGRPVYIRQSARYRIEEARTVDDIEYASLFPLEDARFVGAAPAAAMLDGRVLVAECVPTLVEELHRSVHPEELRSPGLPAYCRSLLNPGAGDPHLIIALDLPRTLRKLIPLLVMFAPLILDSLAEESELELPLSRLPRNEAVLRGFSPLVAMLRVQEDTVVLDLRSATGGLCSTSALLGIPYIYGFDGWPSHTFEPNEGRKLGAEAPGDYEGRPVIGVSVETRESGVDGLPVDRVVPGGGADRAGIRVGDEILALNGELLLESADLGRIVRATGVGGMVVVRLRRQGVILELPVEVSASAGEEAP